jgi:hypothetical protein
LLLTPSIRTLLLTRLVISAYQRQHSATRQACSVWLKNRVHNSYALEVSRRTDQTVIAESEREALRINILPLLAASPSRSISLQLANTLRSIVSHDFPARWRGLVGEIKTLLTTGNVSELHAGCLAALEAVRAFRYGLHGKNKTMFNATYSSFKGSVKKVISFQQ